MELARRSPDSTARGWFASLANNMGWARHDAGSYEDALELFQLALAERRREGRPAEVRIARWSVARCLRSLGQVEEALAEQAALLAELDELGKTDGCVHEEIGECLLALVGPHETAASFARAFELLSPSLAASDSERLARLRQLGGS